MNTPVASLPAKLLPCPGCAGDCTRVIGGPGTKGGPKFWAGCDFCHWRTWGDTEADAIAAWNRRALAKPASVDGLLADLELVWDSVADDKHTNAAYQRLRAALATPEQPGFRMTSDEGGWTKEDALRYIENWCPDYVKDYIVSLEQPGSSVQGEKAAIEAAALYAWEHASWSWEAVKGGLDRFTTPPPAPAAEHGKCDLGVGCDEAGVCYALANGDPEQCGRGFQPEARGVEGMVLVPREPTEAMIEAGRYNKGAVDCLFVDDDGQTVHDFVLAYRAMLAAAPAAPGVQVDEAMANRFMRFFNCEAESTTGTRLYVTERANVLNALTAALAPDGVEGE